MTLALVELVVSAQDRQQTQDLEVEPNEGDGQAERCSPSLALGQASSHTLLNEVEVHDQAEHTQNDGDARNQ